MLAALFQWRRNRGTIPSTRTNGGSSLAGRCSIGLQKLVRRHQAIRNAHKFAEGDVRVLQETLRKALLQQLLWSEAPIVIDFEPRLPSSRPAGGEALRLLAARNFPGRLDSTHSYADNRHSPGRRVSPHWSADHYLLRGERDGRSAQTQGIGSAAPFRCDATDAEIAEFLYIDPALHMGNRVGMLQEVLGADLSLPEPGQGARQGAIADSTQPHTGQGRRTPCPPPSRENPQRSRRVARCWPIR